MIKVGDTHVKKFTITEGMIQRFGELSGDFNPVHFDEEFASKTIFKKRIAHGMLSVIAASGVFGTKFPGSGTIYLSQEVMFVSPVYIDDEVTMHLEVIGISESKKRASIATTWLVDNEPVIVGEAAILLPLG